MAEVIFKDISYSSDRNTHPFLRTSIATVSLAAALVTTPTGHPQPFAMNTDGHAISSVREMDFYKVDNGFDWQDDDDEIYLPPMFDSMTVSDASSTSNADFKPMYVSSDITDSWS